MDFEEFLNRLSNEFDLFKDIANYVQKNYDHFFDHFFYLHLISGNDQKSYIDFDQDLKKIHDPNRFVHDKHSWHPAIMIRTDKNRASMSILLMGEYDSSFAKITLEKIDLEECTKSMLASFRKGSLTMYETRIAFHEIGEDLEQKTSFS